MKGANMTTDWRTVQFFLDEKGVCEVEADASDYKKMRCTCPVFATRRRCKHTRHVKRLIDENDGNYTVRLSEEVTDEMIDESMDSPEAFRTLLVYHAKVEVI